MDALPALVPLEGGYSGETYLSEYAGERAVVRIYGPRSARRGPLAPEIDAAVLGLVRGLLPVPAVWEVRRSDPATDVPGLLVTELLPGERLDCIWPRLEPAEQLRLAGELGVLLGRLGHIVMPRSGMFTDADLSIVPFSAELADVRAWVEARLPDLDWGAADADRLRALADDAQELLSEDQRGCLVHSDFNAKNLLVDPAGPSVTGLVDWEFAHAGSPYADLGNLLRNERDSVFADAVLAAYRDFMPSTPDDLRERAGAADLVALVDLAARKRENPVAAAAHDLLLQLVRKPLQ